MSNSGRGTKVHIEKDPDGSVDKINSTKINDRKTRAETSVSVSAAQNTASPREQLKASSRSNEPIVRKIGIQSVKDASLISSETCWLLCSDVKVDWDRGFSCPSCEKPTNFSFAKFKPLVELEQAVDNLPHDDHDDDGDCDASLIAPQSDQRAHDSQLTDEPAADDTYNPDDRYEMDPMDLVCVQWINESEEHRTLKMSSRLMEKTMQQLDDYFLKTVHDEHGAAYTHDEKIVCDVCRGDRVLKEDDMLVCDICDVAVHRRCYGAQTARHGKWLCRPCSVNVLPTCELCPSTKGAFKSLSSGFRWCHVSCALFTPEIKIGSCQRMEPVLDLANVPPKRWNLSCSVCHIRTGSCVQCSADKCKRAFHVTCALECGFYACADLDNASMIAAKLNVNDNPNDDHISSEYSWDKTALIMFCAAHTKSSEKDLENIGYLSDSSQNASPLLSLIERHKMAILQKLDIGKTIRALELDPKLADVVSYWRDKKMLNKGKILVKIPGKLNRLKPAVDTESLIDKVQNFMALRQNLERVRNMCYMIVKREKFKAKLYRLAREEYEQSLQGPGLGSDDSSLLVSPNSKPSKRKRCNGDEVMNGPAVKTDSESTHGSSRTDSIDRLTSEYTAVATGIQRRRISMRRAHTAGLTAANDSACGSETAKTVSDVDEARSSSSQQSNRRQIHRSREQYPKRGLLGDVSSATALMKPNMDKMLPASQTDSDDAKDIRLNVADPCNKDLVIRMGPRSEARSRVAKAIEPAEITDQRDTSGQPYVGVQSRSTQQFRECIQPVNTNIIAEDTIKVTSDNGAVVDKQETHSPTPRPANGNSLPTITASQPTDGRLESEAPEEKFLLEKIRQYSSDADCMETIANVREIRRKCQIEGTVLIGRNILYCESGSF